ncbi:type I methionyl aminopeptidase [Candidatus Microgenomates bacterium]|nr:type I methionyl aminopeptidase [Candidatus Microgenomates bacterium]
MIPIKNPQEIEIIAQAGKKLAHVKEVVANHIKPGITLATLNRVAEEEIRRSGAEPAFQRVYGYKWATCINVNNGVVHGIPNDYKVNSGDKVSVDVGIYYRGFNTDSAFTVGVPPVSAQLSRFIETGKKALKNAIHSARPGKKVGDISQTLEQVLRGAGYSPVRMFTGHGVGRELHEEPVIPCFLEGKIENTPALSAGMVLAIEAIYTEGTPDIIIEEDKWTARTKDDKMGGLFEETVAITKNGPVILT